MNENIEWYYAEDDKRIGPISKSQFESLIKSGKINSETLVWNKTFSDWRKLGNYQVKEEIKPEREFVKEVEKKPEIKHVEEAEVQSGDFNLLGIVVTIFTIYSLYQYLNNIRMFFYIFQDLFRIDSPYLFYFIIHTTVTFLWCYSLFNFKKKKKNFVKFFKITIILSCLPIIFNMFYYGMYTFLNFNLLFIILAVFGFPYLKKNESSFKEVFIN